MFHYCSYERRSSQLPTSNKRHPQITHAMDTTTENQSKVSTKKAASPHSKLQHARSAFRSLFWTLIIMASVGSGGFFLHNNTSEFLNSTVQTTLDGSVPLSEVYFPSVVVCNINQIRKSFFAELGFYENDTLVRIVYEDFIKGTMEEREESESKKDPKREAFYEVIYYFSFKNTLPTFPRATAWLSFWVFAWSTCKENCIDFKVDIAHVSEHSWKSASFHGLFVKT